MQKLSMLEVLFNEMLYVNLRLFLLTYFHARRYLSTVGGTHSGQSTPHYCPPLIHLHSSPLLPPERCTVSQQVWNRVMN